MTTMTHGILGDISETGARFEADEPPGKGATAVLKWGEHEAVCTIIWHDDGACGVWFKRKLDPGLVAETAAMDRVLELPIASVGNITQGRKRSMGFLKRAAGEHEPLAASAADAVAPSALPEPEFPLSEVAGEMSPPPLIESCEPARRAATPVPPGARMSDVIRAAFRFPAFGRASADRYADDFEDCTDLKDVETTDAFDRPDTLPRSPEVEPTETDPIETAVAPPLAPEFSQQCEDGEGHDACEPIELAEAVTELDMIEAPAAAEPPQACDQAIMASEPEPLAELAFGRAGGLPSPSIGHDPTLAEILRRYRETGSWEK